MVRRNTSAGKITLTATHTFSAIKALFGLLVTSLIMYPMEACLRCTYHPEHPHPLSVTIARLHQQRLLPILLSKHCPTSKGYSCDIGLAPQRRRELHFVCDFPTPNTPPAPITPDAVLEMSFDPPKPSAPSDSETMVYGIIQGLPPSVTIAASFVVKRPTYDSARAIHFA